MSATVQWLRPDFVEAAEDRITSGRLCEQAGISYRQLDFWVRCNLIPDLDHRKMAPGSGGVRTFSPAEAEFVVVLARLVHAGFSPSLMAERLWAQTVDGQLPSRIDMGGGVVVLLEDTTSATAAAR